MRAKRKENDGPADLIWFVRGVGDVKAVRNDAGIDRHRARAIKANAVSEILKIVGEIGLAQDDVGDGVARHREAWCRQRGGDEEQADRCEFREPGYFQNRFPPQIS